MKCTEEREACLTSTIPLIGLGFLDQTTVPLSPQYPVIYRLKLSQVCTCKIYTGQRLNESLKEISAEGESQGSLENHTRMLHPIMKYINLRNLEQACFLF